MPYVIQVMQKSVRFPPICPYCESHKPDRYIHRSFFGGFTGYYIFFFTYSVCRLEIPICSQCQSFAQKLKWVGITLIAGPFIWGLALSPLAGIISLGLIGSGIAVVCYRKWQLSKLRVTSSDDDSTILSTRPLSYAERLATANETHFEARISFKPI
jgi:hypothetical protein